MTFRGLPKRQWMLYNCVMKKQCLLVGAALFAAVAIGETCARFGFDEANGACTLDAVHGLGAVLAGGARWAQGAFGTALATGTRGAAAEVEAIPGVRSVLQLDGHAPAVM